MNLAINYGKKWARKGRDVKVGYVYKPIRFFLITYLISWVSWFIAAYFSYQKMDIHGLFIIPGLVAPAISATGMILSSKNKNLKKEFVNKLTNFRLIKLSSIPTTLLFMPLSIVLSILISILFGQSMSQLQLAQEFSFSAGIVSVLLLIILASIFEEIGWRGYGVDSLSSKYNYFTATIIFAVLWAGWHFPLFFVKNFYQHKLVIAHIFFALNYVVSFFPLAMIIGWLWRKNGGSILLAILLHFLIDYFQEVFQITQITKCIETVVLMLFAGIIVVCNRKMFFSKS
jgi:uncharacterized protein